MPKKKTIEEFVLQAYEKHNSFYSYDNALYLNTKTKLIVTCPIHGDFEQTPDNHLQGQGCHKCGRLKCDEGRKIWTIEGYKEKVQELHPTLVFTDTVYQNPKEKVKYNCPIHGEREVYPYNLLKGCGCKRCNTTKVTITKEMWVERFENKDKSEITYEYLPQIFKDTDTVTFMCKKHGAFEQVVRTHLVSSCQKCKFELTSKRMRENPTGWSYTNWQKAGENSKNFDSFKVYVIRCWNDNEEFYKIGKTFKKLFKRFTIKNLPYEYEEVKVEVYGNAKEASIREKELQSLNIKFKYIPEIQFIGMYECFR